MNVLQVPRWRLHAVVLGVLGLLFIPGIWMLWRPDPPHVAAAEAVPLTGIEERRLAQRQAEEPEVRAAAYRHMFEKDRDVQLIAPSVLCIGMQGFGREIAQHPQEFVQRFSNHAPPVVPDARCHSEHGMWFDDQHRRAVMVWTGVLTWYSPARATVRCVYAVASEVAGELVLELHRSAQGWRVVRSRQEWVA